MMQTIYTQLLQRKREWQPIKPTGQNLPEYLQPLIKHILALRILEIPVSDWVIAATGREKLSPDAHQLVLANSRDEYVHDQALSYAAEAYNALDIPEEARQLQARAIEIAQTEHPLLVAYMTETGLFFPALALLQTFGDATLKLVSQDIARDEQIHIQTNRHITQLLNLQPSRQMTEWWRAAIHWLLVPLKSLQLQPLPNVPPQLTQVDYWRHKAETFIHSGKVSLIHRTPVPAFFEINRRNLPKYNSTSF